MSESGPTTSRGSAPACEGAARVEAAAVTVFAVDWPESRFS
jgi:hypothetical protein